LAIAAQKRQASVSAGYARSVSPRTRVRLLAGAAALAAAGIAVGATLMGGNDDPAPARTGERGPPALELGPSLRDDREARQLRAAERAYDGGDPAAAREQFEALLRENPASLEAAVGAAIAAWPDGTVAKLRALAERAPTSGLVRLHLGLAHYAGGNDAAATSQWREALRADPDTPAALRAEDLLHPEMAPGRPYFYASFGPRPDLEGLSASEQVDLLRREARSGGVEENVLYGTTLQALGRPVSARAAFARALELDATSLAAQVADAVGRFEKANPSAAFSRLGPLTQTHPRSALLRFHLGLLLLWVRNVDEARVQLQRAMDADGRGFYEREARKLLSRLEDIRT
jgi:tetratricopeptide (TPR) repeat protein